MIKLTPKQFTKKNKKIIQKTTGGNFDSNK